MGPALTRAGLVDRPPSAGLLGALWLAVVALLVGALGAARWADPRAVTADTVAQAAAALLRADGVAATVVAPVGDRGPLRATVVADPSTGRASIAIHAPVAARAVVIDGRLHLEVPEARREATGGRWVSVDPTVAGPATPAIAALDVVALLRGATGAVARLGTEADSSGTTVRYAVHVDLARALDAVDDLSRTVQLRARVLSSAGIEGLDAEVWLEGRRLRRVAAPVSGNGAATMVDVQPARRPVPFADPEGGVLVSTDFAQALALVG